MEVVTVNDSFSNAQFGVDSTAQLGQTGQNLTNNPLTAAGVPLNVGNVSGDQVVLNGNGRTTTGNSSGAPPPRPVRLSEVKEKLLRPSLTSNFQCWFNPPNASEVRRYYDAELISLLCSEASLPGSSLATNEINDDFTGVTERFAYRKQYDDRADFTFYVDYGRQSGSYNLILFFEDWIRYAVNETPTAEQNNYFYRANFPDEYRSQAIYINKFERDFKGDYLEYKFLKAYPISMTSMPVSYDSSELLKCTVSFTYTRYVLRNKKNFIEGEPGQVTPAGIPDVGFPENPQFGIDTTAQFGQTGFNLNQNPLSNRRTLGTNPGDVNPGSGGDVPPVTGDLQLF